MSETNCTFTDLIKSEMLNSISIHIADHQHDFHAFSFT